ncbi:MAG: hypothetical protein ACK4FJ_18665 [Ferrovibrio sp.]|uniref:hypothetical protein n=1 Tax=Ferrovibrio sp. TaxID=1917215 RepID=UPI00391C8870
MNEAVRKRLLDEDGVVMRAIRTIRASGGKKRITLVTDTVEGMVRMDAFLASIATIHPEVWNIHIVPRSRAGATIH